MKFKKKKCQIQSICRFENVKLMTPNGDVLIENLNFTVRSGQNVIVVGPNGCGKSSLFRTIGEVKPPPVYHLNLFFFLYSVMANCEWNIDETRQWSFILHSSKTVHDNRYTT